MRIQIDDKSKRMPIVTTEDVLGGKPRLEGRRVSVLQVAELVLDAGDDPATVADQLDLSLVDIHEALAYYYADVDEMEAQRRRREELVERLAEESHVPDRIQSNVTRRAPFSDHTAQQTPRKCHHWKRWYRHRTRRDGAHRRA